MVADFHQRIHSRKNGRDKNGLDLSYIVLLGGNQHRWAMAR